MQNLSIYTFTNIIKFLQVDEIYSKLTLSKLLINQLYNHKVQKLILINYFPLEIIQQINPQNYIQCIKSLKYLKLKEIPFWGIETNGGLSYNNLRFWIGKTFMKTNQPQVGLKKLENSFISGTLAFNQIEFKKALIEYAKNFIDQMGEEITYHFFPDWDDIEDNQVDISKIRIFDIFRSFQIFSYYDDAQDWDCVQYLRNYAQLKHQQIDNMLEMDLYNLKDEDHKIIPQGISLVQEIQINRRTQMNQIVKSILIFTSKEQYIPNNLNDIYNCQTQEKLYQYILQHPEFIPSKTNISLLLNIDPNIVYENEHQLDYLYCTFLPRNDKQPLLWVQFVNPNLDEINLKFDKLTQRLAKSIQMRILDASYQENEFIGLGIAYVSVKGLTLNEVDWTIELLQQYIWKILFILIFFIIIKSEIFQLVSQDDDNDFVGGVFPITDSNSDTYNKALQYAQQHYTDSCKLSGDLQWESLNDSKNQMVQGMLYYFNVTLKGKRNMRFKFGFQQIKSKLQKLLNVNSYEQQYFD